MANTNNAARTAAAKGQAAPAPAATVAPQAAPAPAYGLAAMGAAVTHVALHAMGVNGANAATPPSTAKGAPMLPRLAYAFGQACVAAGLPVTVATMLPVSAVAPYLAALGLNAGHLQGSGVLNSPKHAKGRASHKQGQAAQALPLVSVTPA